MLKSLVLCLQMSGSSLTEDAWLKHCRCTLVWATRLMTFSKYLQAENDIYSIALSLIIELPPTVEVYILMQIDLICLWIELYTHCTVLLKMLAPILSHAHRDEKEPKKKFSCLWYFSLCFQCGMLLSEYFYDADSLEPEIQEKLQVVLKDWQGVFLDGKGITMVQQYHHFKCRLHPYRRITSNHCAFHLK